jgi:glucokinase
MKYAFGIDLGGTNMRVALVGQDGRLVGLLKRKTPTARGPEATVHAMAEMIEELGASHGVKAAGVGIGSPGPLSRKEKKIFVTPNLPGFDNFPLGRRVEELTGLPVLIDNDARCAAYGEAHFGAARDTRHSVLFTFGTGLGGGIFVDGRMLYGKADGGCEVGHLTLHPDGHPCNCGNRGCAEQYLSASAIRRRLKEKGRADAVVPFFEAQAQGENWATELMREIAVDLSIFTASLVNVFDPEVVVFGGGVFSTGGGPLCEWVREGIRHRCFESTQRGLRIVPAALHGDAGVLGAASLVLFDLH